MSADASKPTGSAQPPPFVAPPPPTALPPLYSPPTTTTLPAAAPPIGAAGPEAFNFHFVQAKPEPFKVKLVRKFKENPFIPLGLLATCGFLGVGLYHFLHRDARKQNLMMRGRIAAQGFTLFAFWMGAKMQEKKTQEEKAAAAAAAGALPEKPQQ